MSPGRAIAGGNGAPRSVGDGAFLVDSDDSEFRELVQSLALLSQRALEVREHIGKKLGISGAQYTALTTIRRLQGERGVRVGTLAEELNVKMPTVTSAVAKLEAAGLVDKLPHESDGRGRRIRVSARGEDALLEIASFLRRLNDTCFSGLDRPSFLKLNDSLALLEKNFAKAIDTIGTGQS